MEDQLPLDSSDCCTQTIWAQAQWLSFSPLVCRLRKSSEVLYLLTWARAWNPNFSPRNISYVPRCFENVFGASTLNRLTELSRSYQNVYVRCSQHPQTTFEVQHTERCIKDIILLWSNEDNPQFTDLVRIIATINFQLIFSLGTYLNSRTKARAYDIICKDLLTMFRIIKFILWTPTQIDIPLVI